MIDRFFKWLTNQIGFHASYSLFLLGLWVLAILTVGYDSDHVSVLYAGAFLTAGGVFVFSVFYRFDRHSEEE